MNKVKVKELKEANRVYENVLGGDANEVNRSLKNLNPPEKNVMMSYVFSVGRVYFSLNRSELPKDDVTSVILWHVIESIDSVNASLLLSSLHVAVRYGKYDVVHKLLIKHFDRSWRACYSYGGHFIWMTPIEVAIKNRDESMVAFLLAHNVPFHPPCRSGITRFWDTDPIETLKLDISIDDYLSGSDLSHAIRIGSYDKTLLIMAVVDENMIGRRHVGFSISEKRHDITRLLHTHFKKSMYFEDRHPDTRQILGGGGFEDMRSHRFDLPSLREVSLYTLRVSLIREELSMIRHTLIDVRANGKWMDIRNNLILYPLIKKVIDSTPHQVWK